MYCFSDMFRYAVANKSDREEPTPVQLHGSISIIDLKGGMDRSIKKPDQSSNPTGAPAEISEKDCLGQVSCIQ